MYANNVKSKKKEKCINLSIARKMFAIPNVDTEIPLEKRKKCYMEKNV